MHLVDPSQSWLVPQKTLTFLFDVQGNPQQALKDKGVIDGGCSRHMTGNISYLSDFKEINKGYVAFGGNSKGGKITGKGKIKTGKLDFDDVYLVKELKFNLFSVSQMCDKKNNVLFTDTECVVLSSDFKLSDENHVLLRVPRENNMYNVDLKNIVPLGDLTCLFAKATFDESNLWHRMLGYINFKTMNKLVKGNLVRGLPSKVFENNHTWVTYKKGKQHRASCKTKPVSSVSQPLQRFSLVFFLATKDETSTILKTFITGIKNQINHKVKIIRSNNGTKFKNHDLNQFYGMKGIKREFSVARTPQHNGVAERKNRNLIEPARTMLADLLLPIPFWDEVVNTACYVQDRVLVTKPHIKTPYELLLGRTPSIGFMRPFGCLVTILNTLDPLGKFDGKADEGFLVGYFVSSKAFRVFNSRTRIVHDTLHINFLENQPNVVGSGPTWLFDIDTLTQSMNYQLVVAGNKPNSKPQNTNADVAFDDKENESEVHVSPSSSDKTKKHDEKAKRKAKGKSHVDLSTGVRDLSGEFKEFSVNSTNRVNAVSAPITAVGPNSTNNTNSFNVAGPSDNAVSPNFEIGRKSSFVDPSQYLDDPNMPTLEDIIYSDDEEDVGTEADFSNLETSIIVSPIPTTRVYKDHSVSQIIGDLSLAPQTRSMTRVEPKRVHQALKDPSWIEAIQEELLQFKMQKLMIPSWALRYIKWMSKVLFFMEPLKKKSMFVNLHDLKTLIILIRFTKWSKHSRFHQALRAWYETLANYILENGFQRGKIDHTLFINKKRGDILLVQVYVDDIIFGSTNKELCKAFEKLMKDKFQTSSIGELTFFLGLQVKQNDNGISISEDKYVVEILRKFDLTDGKSASTPIDTKKPLLMDPDGEDVDVHIYRYLKGKPHLGLWYPKDSFFNLVAYSDSDYAGASLDRKSTTGGCQFLGCRLISWQCKKQTVVVTSSTEAEYVAAASCCAQVLWIQNQLLDYGHFLNAVNSQLMLFGLTIDAAYLMLLGHKQFWTFVSIKKSNDVMKLQALIDRKKVIITEDTIRQALRLDNADGVDCLVNEEIFVELTRMGYEKPMVRNMDSSSKFLMYHRFLQLMINAQVDDLSAYNTKYTSPALTHKVFANMRRISKGFSGVDTPLFDGMLVQQQVRVVEDVAEDEDDDNEVSAEPTPPSPTPRLQSSSKGSGGRCIQAERGRIAELDADEDVILVDAEEDVNDDVQGRLAESQVKDNTVMRYQALKRKPVIEAQAKKNMMIYLKNMAGFKMDFFKGMTYNEIRPIFEKHYNLNQAFLERVEEEVIGQKEEGNKRKGDSLNHDAAKKQRIDEETEELKTYLQIVANDDDVVYTEATPLALKVPVVDYQIHHEHNKPYYKIIRADGTHQLFLSFITLLKNIEREDLERLWKLFQERFQSSKPKNFSDDFLLNILKIMFVKPNVEANIWRDQRGRYGLAKVKSWKLFESCGVHIIKLTTTQMILLVEKKYPLKRFTLEQMLNNVILEVKKESKMSLELLRLVRRQLQEGYIPE
nr:hypothetical protein [Tanacetum cinerariifolium]